MDIRRTNTLQVNKTPIRVQSIKSNPSATKILLLALIAENTVLAGPAIDMMAEQKVNPGYYKLPIQGPENGPFCVRHDHMSKISNVLKTLNEKHGVQKAVLEADPTEWYYQEKLLGLKYIKPENRKSWEPTIPNLEFSSAKAGEKMEQAIETFKHHKTKHNARKLKEAYKNYQKTVLNQRNIGLNKAMKRSGSDTVIIYGGAHAGKGDYNSARENEKRCLKIFAPKYIRDLIGPNETEMDKLFLASMLNKSQLNKYFTYTTTKTGLDSSHSEL